MVEVQAKSRVGWPELSSRGAQELAGLQGGAGAGRPAGAPQELAGLQGGPGAGWPAGGAQELAGLQGGPRAGAQGRVALALLGHTRLQPMPSNGNNYRAIENGAHICIRKVLQPGTSGTRHNLRLSLWFPAACAHVGRSGSYQKSSSLWRPKCLVIAPVAVSQLVAPLLTRRGGTCCGGPVPLSA